MKVSALEMYHLFTRLMWVGRLPLKRSNRNFIKNETAGWSALKISLSTSILSSHK